MLLAASPIVGISEQHKLLEVLATAGIKGHGHLATFIASKACGAVSVAAFVWLFLVWQGLFAGVAVLRLAALIRDGEIAIGLSSRRDPQVKSRANRCQVICSAGRLPRLCCSRCNDTSSPRGCS